MSLTNSRLAYRDCYEFMEEALKQDIGARASMGTFSDAIAYRNRLNKARQIDRNNNAQTYEPGHVLHGGSRFDELIFTTREDTTGNFWVYAHKTIKPSVVEPIEAAG